MVIQLDNGQTVTIYEQGNLLNQIESYIDKEIFDLLYDKFNNADELVLEIADIQEDLDNANEYIEELEDKIEKLNKTISELEEELDD
jgi:peptidoglycan hydrolase CwlO-like protein